MAFTLLYTDVRDVSYARKLCARKPNARKPQTLYIDDLAIKLT